MASSMSLDPGEYFQELRLAVNAVLDAKSGSVPEQVRAYLDAREVMRSAPADGVEMGRALAELIRQAHTAVMECDGMALSRWEVLAERYTRAANWRQ